MLFFLVIFISLSKLKYNFLSKQQYLEFYSKYVTHSAVCNMFSRVQCNVIMSYEVEALKTNEFLRRRKLRLQQVREQSKDIAKKIRQKTRNETSRYLKHLDTRKNKEHLFNQEKVVKHLENLYTNQMKQVGSSHRSASCVNQNEQPPEKLDLSKERGKLAAAHLRQTKQQELDHKKLLLERKLCARKAANELSRDKSSVIANKPQEKIVTLKENVETQMKKDNEEPIDKIQPGVQFDDAISREQVQDVEEVLQKDKEVQVNGQNHSTKWQSNVPKLKLQKIGKEDSTDVNLTTSQIASERIKKTNLFAVSKEMPSSLCGGLSYRASRPVSTKSSRNLVSEYLQTRHMRLREYPVIPSKPIGNLESIKETLMHARAIGSKASPLDIEQIKTNGSSNSIARNLVTIYNHTTRDIQDVPLGPEKIVIRESQHKEDAYSQALKESSNSEREGINLKKVQATRSRMAVSKQEVEKEYKDTIAFLNSLPKDKQVRALKKAYVDEYQQNAQRQTRQRKMQEEFEKIEKESKKRVIMAGRPIATKIGNKNVKNDENCLNVADSMKDQYSWIPSPEGEVSFAVHKIPNGIEKIQNSYKQKEVNGFHEYRSRHKHTPPTKDMADHKSNRRSTAVTSQIEDQTNESSSISENDSSFDDSQIKKSKKKLKKQSSVSAREKIIIYKILSNQNENAENKEDKTNSDSMKDIIKSLTSIDKLLKKSVDDENGDSHKTNTGKKTESLSRPKADRIDEASYQKANPQWENGNLLCFVDEKDENLADEKICKRCQCRKHNNVAMKEKSANKGPLQWQVDDDNASKQRSSKGCNECKRINIPTSDSSTNVEKPSAAVNSLRSKTSKIVKGVHAHSEAELNKLMEDDVHETNKFYVGASGVLKDEDYEVIIQLRKKNQRENEKHTVHEVTNKNVKYRENTGELKGNSNTSEKITKIESNASASKICDTGTQLRKEVSDQKLDTQFSKAAETARNTRKSPDVNENISVPNSPQAVLDLLKTNNVVTQATNTSQLHPVVSAGTQTNDRNSPDNRPVFVQMSSSTSTTYLSPPERVLPSYLRSRYAEPINHVDNVSQKSHRKKKCKHKLLDQEKMYMKNNPFSKKIETAINIASSDLCHIYNPRKIKQMYCSGSPYNGIKNNLKSKVSQSKSESPSRGKTKNKYHHPMQDSISDIFCKTFLGLGKYRNRNAKNNSSEQCSCKTMVPLSSCKVSLRRMEKSPKIRQQLKNKSQLNPILKNYVHELLNLNQEGLKAIEIAALQCSSVTTPGSSIINEPSNKPINKNPDDGNIMLSKLEKILNQEKIRNISEKHKKKTNSVSSDNNFAKPSKVFVRRQLKKKLSGQMMGHKIKNLNISKTVLGTKRNLKSQMKKQNSLAFDESSDNNITKKVTKDAKNPQSKTYIPKIRSKISPLSETTDRSKLKRTKTTPGIAQNQSKHFVSNKSNSDESQSENKSSKHTLISNNTANIDNIIVTAAPDKITIILKSPAERNSMTKQIKSEVNDKLIQIPSEDEVAFSTKGMKATANSTQTNWAKIQELELMHFAQNKLHNMEKIASLTDRCTKRLSNLAKVLEEVRKNKSTAYSHISTTDTSSESELKHDKNIHSEKSKTELCFPKTDSVNESKKQLQPIPLESNNEKPVYTEKDFGGTRKAKYTDQTIKHTENDIEEVNSSKYFRDEMERTKILKFGERSVISVATNTEGIDNVFLYTENVRLLSDKEPQSITSTAINIEQRDIHQHASVNTENKVKIGSSDESVVSIAINTEQLQITDYVPMLSDIPRPLNVPSNSFLNKEVKIHDGYATIQPESCSKKLDSHHCNAIGKSRGKPPPALSRVILKKSDEILIPHELSTVIEVDSPMSMKYKKHSPTHASDSKISNSETLESENEKNTEERNHAETNPFKRSDSIDKSLISEIMKDSSQLKMKMMNLSKFNEIMLKPFITMEEYAKQCNVDQLDEGSNHEDLSKAATIDEISSLNSDASMPDIVSELLKRNVISEPFHFDSASHPNSTTLSSESSLPIFALSNATKEKLKSKALHKSKKRVIVSETSDTLSVSSYPDLENAFTKLGMGWASSTLKKTKQTLCLSSSTSTSNSSTLNKYSPKKCDKTVQVSQKNTYSKKICDNKETNKKKQNIEQTSLAKSMTTNEFLVNVLADKMTFSNKSNRDESEEHFTSLYSTKLPNETNLQVTYPPSIRHSEENVRSHTKQRTSTPVQPFKSESYNSSLSSNNHSDGLFSNVDELSSVKLTSSSVKNHSSSEKDELTIPNFSLKVKKDNRSDCS